VTRISAALVLLVLAVPARGGSQSLGDAARKEREKRAGKTPSTRVYGNDDLRGASGGLGASESGSGPAPAAAVGTPEAAARTTDQDPEAESHGKGANAAQDEVEWRRRATPLREALGTAETCVQRLEAEVERLERERLNLLPMRDYYAGPALEQARAGLDQARRELRTARKQWEDFEEEARRAGALPGWLRER
jgi:exonuclease VII small subunit